MSLNDFWNLFMRYWPWLLALIDVFVAASATIHIVLRKQDSRAAISWTGLVWLAPLFGSLAYFLFGINRIQRKAVKLQIQRAWKHHREPQLTEKEVSRLDQFAQENPNLLGLATLGGRLTNRSVLPGNRVELLANGDESFPAMIDAIDQAEHSVNMLSYIFDNDHAGQKFLESLVRAKSRGVTIRVLIDDVGSRYSSPNMIQRLRESGLAAHAFLATRTPRFLKYANLRNHRKILVVDGRVGFTGGTNIREGHWLALEPKYPVQCVHFRIEGPVVSHLQETFAIDWAFTCGEQLEGDDWFPPHKRSGPVWARGIPDGPDEDSDKLSETMQGALATASRFVRIATPYFLPENALISALGVTALRGVDVRIYLPEKNNLPFVQWASATSFQQLLSKGCRIFLIPPAFDHSKLFVVDGVWSLIGSTNWDPRSLRLNFEFNLECYDEKFAQQLVGLVQSKEQTAREITLAEVERTPFLIRLRNGLARLLTPYL